MNLLIIGVDGGGTRTRLVACDGTGKILYETTAPGVNYNAIGLEAARSNLRSAVDEILEKTGRADFDLLCAGMAALDGEASREELIAFAGESFAPERLWFHSDAYITLIGASGGNPGILIICGTGSMGTAIDDRGHCHVSGGWGYLLNDEGSGFDIGNRALRAAAAAYEGGEKTLLLPMTLERFGIKDLRELIPIVYSPNFLPSDIAAVAELADKAAQAGDRVAMTILKTAAASAAATANDLISKAGELPVYVWGGVFDNSRLFGEFFRECLENYHPGLPVLQPKLAAQYGALLAGGARLGLEVNKFSKTIYEKAQNN